jgi:hypothetical protein
VPQKIKTNFYNSQNSPGTPVQQPSNNPPPSNKLLITDCRPALKKKYDQYTLDSTQHPAKWTKKGGEYGDARKAHVMNTFSWT